MKVLIADDDPQMRALLLRAMGVLGHQAEALGDAESLLQRAPAFAPDAVLSDIELPGCDGITAGLRMKEARPGCRIVLMTGSRERAEAARRAGFAPVLDKPFPLEELAEALPSVAGAEGQRAADGESSKGAADGSSRNVPSGPGA